MERLTAIDEHGEIYVKEHDYIGASKKLAEYEDTRLEPEICAEYKKFEAECIGKNVTFANILKIIERLRTSGWIPVTEKLPEDRDWYLAVFKEKDTNYVLIPRVADYMNGHTNNYLTSDGWMIIDCDTNDIPNEYFKTLECIAWQPLPEPYKPMQEGAEQI